MHDHRNVDYLQQAYQDNWQQYLVSLKHDTELGWDVCVLTASDERQAAMYRGQLEWRHTAGLLPRHTRFLVIPDPNGQRIGSGGATLRVLDQLAAEADTLTSGHVLIIHSGGDSRRVPHCSATGKLFARLPRVLPDGRASTVFDEFLIGLSGLTRADLPPGVLIASGDVLLVFDHLQLSFQRGGVIGVAAAASLETGLRHGVYVHGDTPRVRAYLHKPTADELKHWDAIHPDGTVQIDTGLIWLDALTALKFAALTRAEPIAALCRLLPTNGHAPDGALNLYGDLILPLAQSTTYEGYLADTSDGPATPDVQAARQVIWKRLQGTPFSSERLQPAMFIHFGTSHEYWETVAADETLQHICGWTDHAAAWSIAGESVALINSTVERPAPHSDRPALIIDSQLSGEITWQGAALIANTISNQPIALGRDVALHQLPIEGGFVTRCYGLDDDAKRPIEHGTFMNQPWSAWLAAAQIDPRELWPDAPVAARTLWNARLFPFTIDRDEGLNLTLPLQDPAQAPADWRAQWLAAPRYSLAESFSRADTQRILAELIAIEDHVAARHFFTAIMAEQPAGEAKALLGSGARNVTQRCAVVAQWLDRHDVDPLIRLRGYKALAEATEDPAWEDRAFATLAQLIEASVTDQIAAKTSTRAALNSRSVQVAAAARIDFGGGWTDTPPYSLERGGTVLNAAVTLRGKYPIVAEITPLNEFKLILDSHDIGATIEPKTVGDLLTYANPADPFALQKAALVLKGLIPAQADPALPVAQLLRELGGGFKLSTATFIPRGSGLGTSSIMAGAVLTCLGEVTGTASSADELFDEVLCLEQMLTTGGGWQDQVGGLTGGIKLISTAPGLPQHIHVEPVPLSPETSVELASRLILVYTGRQRLAKNLLRAVMGRWLARDPEMVWIQQEIARLAGEMKAALQAGQVDRFGELLAEHWVINQRMDPGCTNPFIGKLFDVMKPHINGGKLAGAGGGGFAMVVARSIQAVRDLSAALATRYLGTPVEIWTCAVPAEGMVVSNS
jgi:fucokinase